MLKTPFRWAARAGSNEAATRFWLLVIAVGIASGLAGGAYVEALRGLTRLLGPQNWARGTHLALFGVIGAAIGAMTLLIGNPGDVELLVDNIHIQGGAQDLRQLPSLIPISLLGIATGSAIGPEAPLVQTTGSLGSWFARLGKVSVIEARSLTITGMAAGFTVLFGTPLGSAIFALEILHRRGLQYYEALVPAALGSLSGYAVYVVTTHLGLTPIWHFANVSKLRASDLGIGALAGVGGAAIAYAFTYLTTWLRRGFRRLPVALRPVFGGLALGALAWMSPYALTFGEGQIQNLVSSKLLVGTLLVAGAAKLLGSSTIVSAGWRGGFIIPLFFMGAALGKAGATVLHVDPTVAMLSMMVAANVGVTKTPFGSALIVVEMAGVRMFPPVLAASLIAFFLTSHVSMIQTQRAREGAFAPEIRSMDPAPGAASERYAGPPA